MLNPCHSQESITINSKYLSVNIITTTSKQLLRSWLSNQTNLKPLALVLGSTSCMPQTFPLYNKKSLSQPFHDFHDTNITGCKAGGCREFATVRCTSCHSRPKVVLLSCCVFILVVDFLAKFASRFGWTEM